MADIEAVVPVDYEDVLDSGYDEWLDEHHDIDSFLKDAEVWDNWLDRALEEDIPY